MNKAKTKIETGVDSSGTQRPKTLGNLVWEINESDESSGAISLGDFTRIIGMNAEAVIDTLNKEQEGSDKKINEWLRKIGMSNVGSPNKGESLGSYLGRIRNFGVKDSSLKILLENIVPRLAGFYEGGSVDTENKWNRIGRESWTSKIDTGEYIKVARANADSILEFIRDAGTSIDGKYKKWIETIEEWTGDSTESESFQDYLKRGFKMRQDSSRYFKNADLQMMSNFFVDNLAVLHQYVTSDKYAEVTDGVGSEKEEQKELPEKKIRKYNKEEYKGVLEAGAVDVVTIVQKLHISAKSKGWFNQVRNFIGTHKEGESFKKYFLRAFASRRDSGIDQEQELLAWKDFLSEGLPELHKRLAKVNIGSSYDKDKKNSGSSVDVEVGEASGVNLKKTSKKARGGKESTEEVEYKITGRLRSIIASINKQKNQRYSVDTIEPSKFLAISSMNALQALEHLKKQGSAAPFSVRRWISAAEAVGHKPGREETFESYMERALDKKQDFEDGIANSVETTEKTLELMIPLLYKKAEVDGFKY